MCASGRRLSDTIGASGPDGVHRAACDPAARLLKL